MKLRFKSIRTICAAIMMIAALVVSAAATDDTSIEDQMAANSAAWWIAYENGDQETMDALHAENEALAAELAGEGGEANYNEESGSWDITTEDGSHISSSGDGQNKGIPPHQFLFNAGSIDKRSYMDMLQLEEAEFNLIKFPQRGVCLYKCGNERYLLEVHAPAYKEKLFGKAGGR